MDLFSEAIESVGMDEVNKILLWKTAFYTFINPLHLGAILAGAGDKDMKVLSEYGLNAGQAFQLTDDIIGTFGAEAETGKSIMDDIKEGKRTMLSVLALQRAAKSDAYFLESALGKQDLTSAEFNRCKEIITETKALADTKAAAKKTAAAAVKALNKQKTAAPQADFLIDLVNYLLVRKS